MLRGRGVLAGALTAVVAFGASTAASSAATPIEQQVDAVVAQGAARAGVVIAPERVGFFVQRVGGEVDASRDATSVFSPASAIKVVVAYSVMRDVQAGTKDLDRTTVQVREGQPEDCPLDDAGNAMRTMTLRDAMTAMLRPSDNLATDALAQLQGQARVQADAEAAGLEGVRFGATPEHPTGCADPGELPEYNNANRFSVAGLAKLYAGIADGSLLRSDLSAQLVAMLNGFGDPYTPARAARPAGMTDAQFAPFLANQPRRTWQKGGDARVAFAQGRSRRWATLAGGFTTPRCDEDDRPSTATYAFGVALHGIDFDGSDATSDAIGQLRVDMAQALLDGEVTAAVRGWGRCFLPRTTTSLAGADVVYDGRPHAATPATAPQAATAVSYVAGGGTPTAGIPVHAGSYAATARVTDAAYGGDRARATVTIAPRAATVTAPDVTITQGQALPTLTPRVDGLAAGDDLGAVGDVRCAVDGDATAVGSHPITCTGATDPDYRVDLRAGTLTVRAAPTPSPAASTPVVPPTTPVAPAPASAPVALATSPTSALPATLRRSARSVSVRAGCPASAGRCAFELRVLPATGTRVLGRASTTIAAGRTTTLKARLSPATLRRLARARPAARRVVRLQLRMGGRVVQTARVRLT